MNEQILEDFFLGKIEAKDFVNTAFTKQSFRDGEFIVTRSHLLKLCESAIAKEITVGLLEVIADNIIFSDYFSWDNDSEDGEIVTRTIFEWGDPSINYEINELNLMLWREYLRTGEYKHR